MIGNAIISARGRKSPSIGIKNTFKTRVLADSGTFEADDCLVALLKDLRQKGVYEKASILLTPNGFKSAKLYAAKATDGSTDFTSGGGGGSRRNASGSHVSVSTGWPKIDYPSAGACPDILLERAATNLLLNSTTLASQSVTTVAQYYILSFYGTGTVTVGESTPVVLNGTGTDTRVFVKFASSGGSKTITVTGTVTRAQLEATSNPDVDFPTSWIPTTGAMVTRTASTLVKIGLSSVIQSQGVIIMKVTRSGTGVFFRMDDGTGTNSIRLFNTLTSNGIIQLIYVKNNVDVSTTVLTTVPAEITIAIRYNANSYTVYINGAFFYTMNNDTPASAAFSRFSFSPSISAVSRIKYFAYIPGGDATAEDMIKYSTP